MKVLFITKSLKMEPLGLMYLSSAAKAAGHEVELTVYEEYTNDYVIDYKPNVIGYSVMTGDQDFYLDINRQLKKIHRFISIFGGPHPTFFPEIINENGVDLICRGEGEEALVELLENLDLGERISYIKNIEIDNIGTNGLRKFSNIDSLTFPDRELVGWIDRIAKCRIKHFIASRGCPYKCSYCFNEQYSKLYPKQKRVRFRNVDSLIKEIKDSTDHNSFVYFQDDTFTINKKWLENFAYKYKETISLPFHCHVRANTLDGETASILKFAGCRSVHLAAECANDKIRNELLKRNMSKEQIYNACKLLKHVDIKFMLQNMIGLPTGTIDDDLDTLEMNIKCQPDYAWVSIYQPYPGTWLGEWCKKYGIYKGDFSDIGSNFFTTSVLDFPKEYKRQLAVLQKIFACFVHDSKQYERKFVKYILKSSYPENFEDSYKEERERGDEVLYGFKP